MSSLTTISHYPPCHQKKLKDEVNYAEVPPAHPCGPTLCTSALFTSPFMSRVQRVGVLRTEPADGFLTSCLELALLVASVCHVQAQHPVNCTCVRTCMHSLPLNQTSNRIKAIRVTPMSYALVCASHTAILFSQ